MSAQKDRDWLEVYSNLEGSQPIESAERYTVLEEVGKGGAKIVFRAVDNHSGREVAYAKPLDNQANKQQLFLREARITSYLQHPNILPVYDVSNEEDLYFVCKLLRGESLTEFCDQELSQEVILTYFKKICEAMEYAHSRGVLHLDLKPENIRLDRFGEVLIIDWGLAEIFCTESEERSLSVLLTISQPVVKIG